MKNSRPRFWLIASLLLGLILVALTDTAIIRWTSQVKVTAHGIEFADISTAILVLGLVTCACALGLASIFRSKKLAPKILAGSLVLANWYWIEHVVADIQFRRTPPCWGMHSIDPGSGEGCPDGMKQDFTVAQLRTYYRSIRKF